MTTRLMLRDGSLRRIALKSCGDGRCLHGANPDGKHKILGDVFAMLRNTQRDDGGHGKEADYQRFDIYEYHCAPPFGHNLIIDNLPQ